VKFAEALVPLLKLFYTAKYVVTKGLYPFLVTEEEFQKDIARLPPF
jgi:hypothetical protein